MMNRIVLKLSWLLVLIFFSCKNLQKKASGPLECREFIYDVNLGEINGVKPSLSQAEIREWFPCYTHVVADGSTNTCGGAVVYQNHGFVYYTFWDFVEIDRTFKGEVKDNFLHKNRKEIKTILGDPVETKYKEERPNVDFFPAPYGCIRIEYSGGKVNKIASHYYQCDQIELCD